jgi:hypothetical protein
MGLIGLNHARETKHGMDEGWVDDRVHLRYMSALAQ